ncbi:MAG: 6-phosphofructokinase [Bacteroidota bacterium]
MKSIAVLTSGGDAPGMNAAIRTVVRLGIDQGWEVFGVRNGYAGLLDQRIEPLGARDVGSILQRGGTVLGSARFPEWKQEEVRAQALSNLRDHRIEALVVIGGNGSQAGAHALSKMGFPVVGIASTIDNDLACTDTTIGVDTALNTALESIDRLRTTATSHKRAFVVEVMGRNCGYLALMAGIAGGADAVVIPEAEVQPEDIAADLRAAYARGKPHALVVVAEGAKLNAAGLLKHFESNRGRLGFDMRATTLGHVQRGGAPSAFDRLLATRLSAGAIEHLARGQDGCLVGFVEGGVRSTPFETVMNTKKSIDLDLLKLARVLAA